MVPTSYCTQLTTPTVLPSCSQVFPNAPRAHKLLPLTPGPTAPVVAPSHTPTWTTCRSLALQPICGGFEWWSGGGVGFNVWRWVRGRSGTWTCPGSMHPDIRVSENFRKGFAGGLAPKFEWFATAPTTYCTQLITSTVLPSCSQVLPSAPRAPKLLPLTLAQTAPVVAPSRTPTWTTRRSLAPQPICGRFE